MQTLRANHRQLALAWSAQHTEAFFRSIAGNDHEAGGPLWHTTARIVFVILSVVILASVTTAQQADDLNVLNQQVVGLYQALSTSLQTSRSLRRRKRSGRSRIAHAPWKSQNELKFPASPKACCGAFLCQPTTRLASVGAPCAYLDFLHTGHDTRRRAALHFAACPPSTLEGGFTR
jgi:hypothetical protein